MYRYCRIVAAEVLGRLTLEWSIREQVEQAGAVLPLIHLLRLKHSPGVPPSYSLCLSKVARKPVPICHVEADHRVPLQRAYPVVHGQAEGSGRQHCHSLQAVMGTSLAADPRQALSSDAWAMTANASCAALQCWHSRVNQPLLVGVQMLDNVEGPVHHLAYERGEDVIVMKGYKFAKAKTAAAATLGCLALANSAVATQLVQVSWSCFQPSVFAAFTLHCLLLAFAPMQHRVVLAN